MVWELIVDEVALSVGDREVRFRAALAGVDVPIDTCPPDVARTPAMAPLVSSQRAHDVHGDAPDAVEASTLAFHAPTR